MRHSSPNRPPAAGRGPTRPDPAAALAGLLDAHDDGLARGDPVLTEAGVAHVRRLLVAARAGVVLPTVPAAAPHWDPDGRRLWLSGRLLKEFHQPAPFQTAILAAFEEDGWASGRIDDPLPPEPGDGEADAKRRLHATIQNLNRGLPAGTIRFHGDGTGAGVCWGFCAPVAGGRPPARRYAPGA